MTATDDVDPDTRYAVGIDVGDGESCILWLDTTDPAAEAQVYERARPAERVVLTALARHRDSHEPVFGEAALLGGDAIQFSVNLKRIPKASLSTPDMVLFAQAFLDEFFAAHPDVRADCQILVGYPTGWPDSARDLYRRFLRTSDIPLALLPESQSALVHVWDLQERDIDNVLVVDIGSSTVDVTMVTDMNPLNIELGTELGCGDIDKQLAQMAVSALADAPEFARAMEHNDAPTLLRLACRRAKEAQFSGQSLRLHDLQEALRPRLGPVVELASGWLRAQDIPHLVEKHWAGRFRDLLREVKEKLARTPEVVVLTGGGSRMPVTRRICAEVFPEALLELDGAPSFSVGRGLASAGRHRLQALRFRRDAIGVANSPEVVEALRASLAAAFTTVRDAMLAALRNTELEQWQEVVESPPGLEEAARDIEETIDRTVRPLVDRICDAYRIPGTRRRLDTKLAPPRLFTIEFMNRVMSMPDRPDIDGDLLKQGHGQITKMIGNSVLRGVGDASLRGAAGLAEHLRGGMRAGGKTALFIGVAFAGVWTAQTVHRRVSRRRALSELAGMELSDEAIAWLERTLLAEIHRLVEQRIAPLERMVR